MGDETIHIELASMIRCASILLIDHLTSDKMGRLVLKYFAENDSKVLYQSLRLDVKPHIEAYLQKEDNTSDEDIVDIYGAFLALIISSYIKKNETKKAMYEIFKANQTLEDRIKALEPMMTGTAKYFMQHQNFYLD